MIIDISEFQIEIRISGLPRSGLHKVALEMCKAINEPVAFANKPDTHPNLVAKNQVVREDDGGRFPFDGSSRVLISCIESGHEDDYESGILDVRHVSVVRAYHNWLPSWSRRPNFESWIGGNPPGHWHSRVMKKSELIYFDAFLTYGFDFEGPIFRGIDIDPSAKLSEEVPTFGGGSSFGEGESSSLTRYKGKYNNPIWNRWKGDETAILTTQCLNQSSGLPWDHGIHESCLPTRSRVPRDGGGGVGGGKLGFRSSMG